MYYIIFLIGVVFIFLPKYHKISAFIFTVFLLVLALFRYGVGTDFYAYEYLYNSFNKTIFYEIGNSEAREEILFRIISTIGNKFSISYIVSLSFYSIISLVCIYKAATKYSTNALLSIFTFYSFFYFVWIFSGIRQGIVISIATLIILFCYEKNKNKTLIVTIILLSMIHVSVLVVLVLYFVAKINWSKKLLFYLFIVSFFISLLPINIFDYASMLTERIASYKPNNKIINLDFQSIVRLCLVSIVFLLYSKIIKINTTHHFIVKYYILGMCMYFLLKDIELVAARVSIYSRVLEIFIVPAILYITNKKNIYITLLIMIIFLFIYFNKELINMGQNISLDKQTWYVPYTNIFNKDNFYFVKERIFNN